MNEEKGEERREYVVGGKKMRESKMENEIYIVQKKIGNMGDMKMRGIEKMDQEDIMECEDKRVKSVMIER